MVVMAAATVVGEAEGLEAPVEEQEKEGEEREARVGMAVGSRGRRWRPPCRCRERQWHSRR
jgi:hypothetical protein